MIAQAAATVSLLLDGRFALGVGSGAALNEHILSDVWPDADERLEMLEEAIQVIRTLWAGGVRDHRGRHYRVANARIYDLPESPPPIYVSGFGPKAIDLAARIGDGYCTVGPDGDAVTQFREHGGEGKLVQGGVKVCWVRARPTVAPRRTALWPNEALPGELAQVPPTPAHFDQAAELVTEEMVAAE